MSGYEDEIEKTYYKAYGKNNALLRDSLKVVITAIGNNKGFQTSEISDILSENDNMKIFGKMYELIAEDYVKENNNV